MDVPVEVVCATKVVEVTTLAGEVLPETFRQFSKPSPHPQQSSALEMEKRARKARRKANKEA